MKIRKSNGYIALSVKLRWIANLRAAWPGASWRRPRSSEMMKSLSENQAKSRFQFVFILLFLLLFSLLSENLMSKTDPKKKGKTSKPHGKKKSIVRFCSEYS
jgi:hypothetical protein